MTQNIMKVGAYKGEGFSRGSPPPPQLCPRMCPIENKILNQNWHDWWSWYHFPQFFSLILLIASKYCGKNAVTFFFCHAVVLHSELLHYLHWICMCSKQSTRIILKCTFSMDFTEIVQNNNITCIYTWAAKWSAVVPFSGLCSMSRRAHSQCPFDMAQARGVSLAFVCNETKNNSCKYTGVASRMRIFFFITRQPSHLGKIYRANDWRESNAKGTRG